MVEPVAVLIPHPQVARVRKVDRKPTSGDEDKNKNTNKNKNKRAEREILGLSKNRSLGHKGTICDILL